MLNLYEPPLPQFRLGLLQVDSAGSRSSYDTGRIGVDDPGNRESVDASRKSADIQVVLKRSQGPDPVRSANIPLRSSR
jgi:hypothetical protein